MVSVLRHFCAALALGLVVAMLSGAPTVLNPVQALKPAGNLVLTGNPSTGWGADANTATLLTKLAAMSGACNFINSTNGTTSYTYDFGPTCQMLGKYTFGARYWLVTDTGCPANCWLTIRGLGIVSIKRSDGTTDPGGQFDFTQGVPIWYDGKVFRLEWQH